MMRILVAGAAGGGQRAAVKTLTGAEPTGSLEGLVVDHTFETRYFTQDCGLYVDEWRPGAAGTWVSDFVSDEARQVRAVLAMFVYTFSGDVDPAIAEFVAKLQEEGWRGQAVAVPAAGFGQAGEDAVDQLEDWGFLVIEPSELLDVAHTAIVDFGGGDSDDDGDARLGPDEAALEAETVQLTTPLVPGGAIDDLDGIMAQLRLARDSDMTPEEKLALARELAAKLVI